MEPASQNGQKARQGGIRANILHHICFSGILNAQASPGVGHLDLARSDATWRGQLERKVRHVFLHVILRRDFLRPNRGPHRHGTWNRRMHAAVGFDPGDMLFASPS